MRGGSLDWFRAGYARQKSRSVDALAVCKGCVCCLSQAPSRRPLSGQAKEHAFYQVALVPFFEILLVALKR
jgi:hypothetical protein